MKTRRSSLSRALARVALLLGLVFTLGGCKAVKFVFNAGVATGIAVVFGLLIVAGGIFALVSRKA